MGCEVEDVLPIHQPTRKGESTSKQSKSNRPLRRVRNVLDDNVRSRNEPLKIKRV